MVGDEWERIAVHPMDRRIVGFTKASRARRDLCERPLQVHRRTGDHLQDLRCDGLLLARLGEFSLKLLLRSATNLNCARHRDSGRHSAYQSRECSGEIVSMTPSRNAILR